MVEGLTRDEAKRLADRVLALSTADGCQVNVQSGVDGNTRFAANQNADLFHLGAREVKCEQLDLGLFAGSRVANDADELIKVGERNQVAFQ